MKQTWQKLQNSIQKFLAWRLITIITNYESTGTTQRSVQKSEKKLADFWPHFHKKIYPRNLNRHIFSKHR